MILIFASACLDRSPSVVKSFAGAKFEPADGKIYSGAGQNTVDALQVVNISESDRQPMLIAVYDGLHWVNNGIDNTEVAEAHNRYPGAKLQIGLQLPNETAVMQSFGNGSNDHKIRKLGREYKALNQDIFLRIGYEFDGPWSGYEPTAYINTFRRIVDVFRSEGVNNVAFVWCSYTPSNPNMFNWYPGDSYVDWFAFNVWGDDSVGDTDPSFDASWFMSQAAAHNKPVLIGEGSRRSNVFTWDQWFSGYITSLRNSGVKAYQLINQDWPVYAPWASWGSGKFTGNPSSVSLYQQEMQNTKYIHRDSTHYRPMALYVEASRRATASINNTSWSAANDERAFASSAYNYAVVNALHHYGDGWYPYWINTSGTNYITINITVPAGLSGYVTVDAFAYSNSTAQTRIPHDVLIGSLQVLDQKTPEQATKFAFTASDTSTGLLSLKIQTTNASHIRIHNVAVQTISPSAVGAPQSLQVSSTKGTSIGLNWAAVTNAQLYNIYRDGVLVGTSTTTSFIDQDLAFDRGYTYRVSAWHSQTGEGSLSSGVSASTGRLNVYVRGSDNAIWMSRYNGVSWSSWYSISATGSANSRPGVVAQKASAINAFVRGTDNAVWNAWSNDGGATWSSWHSLSAPSGGAISGPIATSQGDGHLNLFVRGSGDVIWHRAWDGGPWSSWESVGSPSGGAKSGPAAVSQSYGNLNLFVRGADLAIWHKWYGSSAGWSPWYSIGGPPNGATSDPALTSQGDGLLNVFVRGSDNAIWHAWWSGGSFSPWYTLGGPTGGATTSPIAVSCGYGRIDIFVVGADNALWQNTYSAGSFSGWVSRGGTWTSGPGASC